MKKWMVVPILIVTFFLGMPNYATATETAKNDTVYVAGNPDLFPFEYYDTQSDSYQGILPAMYKQISETTGLKFVYVHPGTINLQSRLAKNGQVELVSAHVRGQIEATEGEWIVQRLDADTEICIAFTAITPDQTETQIRSADRKSVV